VMRWGLVPFWSKDGKAGYSTINARAETVTTSAAYREAMKKRRCLVPADWFYEWQKLDAKTKQPFAIALADGALFAFAGLWETWRNKATGPSATGQGTTGQNATGQSAASPTLETYTIITTDPNELTERFHDRMPVILRQRDYARWLAPGDPAQLPVDLLRPYAADEMKAWKVGPDVGNVRNNRPDLVELIE
jgi:putative SOS response-associated peptidase YedK